MADAIELRVVTPERELVREQVSEVQIRGQEGYMGILPGHAPLVSLLGAGPLTYIAAGQRKLLCVDGGFVEVLPEHVRVLANLAEKPAEIDVAKARADLAKAQHDLANPANDSAPALAAVALAEARIATAEQK